MSAAAAARLAQECYDQAIDQHRPSRDVARELVAEETREVLEFLAAEYLVAEVQRAKRQATLDAERKAQQESQAHENAGGGLASRIPRKGSRERDRWERETEEGRAWAQAEEDSWIRNTQMMQGVIQRALDRYTEELRIQWTAELLDSTFTLADGTPVAWGDATVEQHEERRGMFLANAHANMEGAARHEVAIRELHERGANTLREMVGVAA